MKRACLFPLKSLHVFIYQLFLLYSVLCVKAKKNHACMLMKMERSRTKGTNVQRLNRMPKNIEHGRTDS